jgi:hypothetical protein
MNPHNQKMLLQELQNEAMEILSKAVSVWQLVPHDKFALQPTTDSWSANECLQHLNSYGKYYLPAIEKSLNKAVKTDSVPDFSSGWLGNYFTKLMLPKANGVPSKEMKSPKDHVPKQILESHLVIAEFIDQQEKLLLLLQKAKNIDLNKSRVGISIAPFIKLKLGDVFMFLIAHLKRHVNQAERALGEVIQKDKSPVL